MLPHRVRHDADTTGHDARLIAFIADDFPKLRRYLGETRFAGMVRDYNARFPSEAPSSGHLAKFLGKTPPYARKPELAELALFERVLGEARDAADSPVLGKCDAARFERGDLRMAGFVLTPSLRRLRVRSNVTSLWSSLRCDELPPAPFMLTAPQELLIWRQGTAPRFRMLGNEEALAIDAMREGASFDAICKMLGPADQSGTATLWAAAYLRGWLEAGLIAALRADATTGGNTPDRCA